MVNLEVLYSCNLSILEYKITTVRTGDNSMTVSGGNGHSYNTITSAILVICIEKSRKHIEHNKQEDKGMIS